MKKKFSKILGMGLAVSLVLSLVLMAAPVGAGSNTVTVTSDPLGTAVDPVRGDFTITVQYSGGKTPAFMYLIMGVPTMYGHSANVLGQEKGALTGSMTIKLVADSDDPTDHPTWDYIGGSPAPGLADQFGFVGATYNNATMTWTMTFNTQKKCAVGDNYLLDFGWWPGQEVYFDGEYNPVIEVYFDGDPMETPLPDQPTYIFDNPVHIQPELGLDAKGSQQKFWLNWIDMIEVGGESVPVGHLGVNSSVGGWVWVLDPGVNLTTWGDAISPYDIKVLAGGRPYRDSGGDWYPAEMIAGPFGDPMIPFPDRFIEVVARAPILGDAEFEVWTAILADGTYMEPPEWGTPIEVIEQVASAEKKWGELDYSKLDVHIDFEFEDGHPVWSDIKAAVETDLEVWTEAADHEVTVNAGSPDYPVKELVAEKVWASFLQLEDPLPAGGALVNWWLVKDTEANQLWIQDMMDDIVARAGDLGFRGHDPDEVDSNEYWSATGDYEPAPADHPAKIIMDWIDPSGTTNDKYATKTNLIKFVPDIPWDPYLEKYTPMGDTPYINYADGAWYGRSVTMDNHLGEIPGVTIALIENVGQEHVLIITLVEYQQDYNGENLILIQIGKKHFGVPPPPAQVKTTQVRWAGEKIVLEKDWGTDHIGDLVMFALEEGSIGVLIPLGPYDLEDIDSRTVFTDVDCGGVARVMFKTEQQGQVDVECVLYDWYAWPGASFDEVAQAVGPGVVIANTGFIVYYLFLEEVTPWDKEPEPVDPDVSAVFAVDVKGSFWTTSLPLAIDPETGEVRAEKGGLPRGRYVLPDDWPQLAGPAWQMLRPWMDIMADPGNVSSTYELGPFKDTVNSPSGEAALPTIGPFSSLQQWSVVDQWLTDATVPADGATDMDPFLAGNQNWSRRNTVIPDGVLTPFDCPMPPAEIHFVITDYSVPFPLVEPFLFDAFKNSGPTYDWPFFASEIPANRLIPPMLGTVEGYWWNSWDFGPYTPDDAFQSEGPYWFHWDLGQTPLDDTILEAYSDNLGTAAVYIDAIGGSGYVTIKAFADYPYLPAKFPPVESDEVTQPWGAVELNPFFLADKTIVEVGEVVTFTNETTFGTLPYTAADWNWGDGTTHGITAVNNGDTITHAYNTPGVYSVTLTMTDSTPTTRWEERPNYILVTGEVVEEDILAYYRALTGAPLVADLADVVAAANDYLGGVIPTGFTAPITLSQLVELANEWLGL